MQILFWIYLALAIAQVSVSGIHLHGLLQLAGVIFSFNWGAEFLKVKVSRSCNSAKKFLTLRKILHILNDF